MDGEVGKNWTGIIPSELVFQRAKLVFGPPSYRDAVLNTDEVGKEIAIPIIYPSKEKPYEPLLKSCSFWRLPLRVPLSFSNRPYYGRKIELWLEMAKNDQYGWRSSWQDTLLIVHRGANPPTMILGGFFLGQ